MLIMVIFAENYIIMDTLRFIVRIILWIWQFPQNLCALVYMNRPFDRVDSPCRHYRRHGWSSSGSVTLGEYIFTNARVSLSTIRHEYGHIVQSRILGPLYLLVIGLPSILHAAVHNRACKGKEYNHFYTERWADSLSSKYFGKGWLFR